MAKKEVAIYEGQRWLDKNSQLWTVRRISNSRTLLLENPNKVFKLPYEVKLVTLIDPSDSVHMKELDLVDALWYFIENVEQEDPQRNETFFYLRERVRAHQETAS